MKFIDIHEYEYIFGRCDTIAKMYPFSTQTVYDLYVLIYEHEKNKKMTSTEEFRFDILMRVLEMSAIHYVNPFTVVYIIYSDGIMELFVK